MTISDPKAKNLVDRIIELLAEQGELSRTQLHDRLTGAATSKAAAIKLAMDDPRVEVVQYSHNKKKLKLAEFSLQSQTLEEVCEDVDPKFGNTLSAPHGFDENLPQTPKTEPVYTQPYPQPALGGELGVTSLDIARALGVRHQHVTSKLSRMDRGDWHSHSWRATPYEVAANTRTENGWSLNSNAAKYVVGTWQNEVGRGYFAYLLKCESTAEAKHTGLSPERISEIIAAVNRTYDMMYPQLEKRIEEKVTPKIETNTTRHDEAMLSASQQALCQPLFSTANAQRGCSMIHSLIKKAAKVKFRPDAPASDCTWHKIRQSDFEALVDFIRGYKLTELDVKRVEKFWRTEAGKKDRAMWGKRLGYDPVVAVEA